MIKKNNSLEQLVLYLREQSITFYFHTQTSHFPFSHSKTGCVKVSTVCERKQGRVSNTLLCFCGRRFTFSRQQAMAGCNSSHSPSHVDPTPVYKERQTRRIRSPVHTFSCRRANIHRRKTAFLFYRNLYVMVKVWEKLMLEIIQDHTNRHNRFTLTTLKAV